MSSEGGAAILIIPVGLVLGPAVLAAAAAAGVVIVVAGTAMWAGQQLHARYVDRCASWGRAEERLIAQSRGNIVSLDALLAGPLAEFRRRAKAQPDNTGQPSPEQARAFEAEIQRALTEAMAAPAPAVAAPTPRQRELEHERAELAIEVAVAREQGIDAGVVATAEGALSGDAAQVAVARAKLRQAWAAVTETGRILARQREQATIRLALVRGAASVLRAQAGAGALTLTPEQSVRLSEVELGVSHAEQRLAVLPEIARQDAERLQRDVEEIESAAVITTSAAGVTGPRAEAARLKGRLQALDEMAREAIVYNYATKDDWLTRIRAIETALAEPHPDLAALSARADGLQREVFAAIDHGEGRAIAGQIAEVMGASGFRQDAQGQRALEIEELADGAWRVVGLRNDAPAGMGRDDKRVTFTVEPGDGERGMHIAYDFAGYVGDACHADMRAIFDGLRNRGIIIADPRWQPPSGAALTEGEAQAAPLPEIVTNKQQALITAAICEVFRRMGASDDEIEVRSTGGQAHLSMRKGDLGYYEYGVNRGGEVTHEDYKGPRPPAEALAPTRAAIAAARARTPAKRATTARQQSDEEGYVRDSGADIQQ